MNDTQMKETKHPAKLDVHTVNVAVVATEERGATPFKKLHVYTREGERPEVSKIEGKEAETALMFLAMTGLPVDDSRDVFRVVFGSSGIAVRDSVESFGRLVALTQDPSVKSTPDRNIPVIVAGALFGILADPDESIELDEQTQAAAAREALRVAARNPMLEPVLHKAIEDETREFARKRGIPDDAVGKIEGDEYVALASMDFGDRRTGISTVTVDNPDSGLLIATDQRKAFFEPDNPPVYSALSDEEREQFREDTDGEFVPVGAYRGMMIVREPGGPFHHNWLAGDINILVTEEHAPPVKGSWVPKQTADKMGFKGRGYRKGRPDNQANLDVLGMV